MWTAGRSDISSRGVQMLQRRYISEVGCYSLPISSPSSLSNCFSSSLLLVPDRSTRLPCKIVMAVVGQLLGRFTSSHAAMMSEVIPCGRRLVLKTDSGAQEVAKLQLVVHRNALSGAKAVVDGCPSVVEGDRDHSLIRRYAGHSYQAPTLSESRSGRMRRPRQLRGPCIGCHVFLRRRD